ncbi:SusD/RagB family nutrient-binding outer membrane lipoprotein [Pedobacter frigoris]|uniref:SusD/RagB family nutrient-binding outer membrane lipoprotein n=1 Tax=Pedobacter frigoris TaxID=2571272 RepID=A0A4U1CKX2_9SPHI|nr:SusD/RagB family nutrient-binding outer membrane lipoprotein [Pedobacter frigoris]TKC07306.1 SusD/RagB family nutrient-binding outer membrane lipoprotein [Pedobacter frigoris]
MKKNRKNIAYILLAGLSLSVLSCTKDFTDVNTDPIGEVSVAPERLLAPTLVNLMSTNMLRNRNFNNELMQVTVNVGDSEGRIFRYDVRRTQADNTWNNWYVSLTDIKDIYTTAGKPENLNKSYQGVSLIVQAWIYQLLTDTYGDVPYTEANRGKESLQPSSDSQKYIQPAFDRQKDIYLDLFKKLEEANELLKAGTAIVPDSDPVYKGDIAKWRKLGNSLYLRLLMRIAGKAEVSASVRAKIKEIIDTNPANYPVMQNNDASTTSPNGDNGRILWNGSNSAASLYASPYIVNVRPNDFRLIGLCDFFLGKLVTWGHPCVTNMDAPSYTSRWSIDGVDGIPSGYAPGEISDIEAHFNSDQDVDGTGTAPRKKTYNLQRDAYTGIIMTVAELSFIKAEAAAKGWISGNAGDFYHKGIADAINYWRPNLITSTSQTNFVSYLTTNNLLWNPALPLDNLTYGSNSQMEMIHLQKYYALFLVDFQQWFEHRRTGHPILPKGNGLVNGGKMPARLFYPTITQSTNPANYKDAVAMQGADDINTLVWWQKP